MTHCFTPSIIFADRQKIVILFFFSGTSTIVNISLNNGHSRKVQVTLSPSSLDNGRVNSVECLPRCLIRCDDFAFMTHFLPKTLPLKSVIIRKKHLPELPEEEARHEESLQKGETY